MARFSRPYANFVIPDSKDEFSDKDFTNLGVKMQVAKVHLRRPWLSATLFGHSELKITGYKKLSVSGGVMPKRMFYAANDKPLLPYFAHSAIVARDVRIEGFNRDAGTQAKLKALGGPGSVQKIFNFELPKDKGSIEVGKDYVRILNQPCILGYMVQPFVRFPPKHVDIKGASACIVENHLDHNKIGRESASVVIDTSHVTDAWPLDQKFFVYIIRGTTSDATHLKRFEDMLRIAILQMGSGARYSFDFVSTFEDDDSNRGDGQYLNISFDRDGYDYTCGTGTKIYKPQYEDEPNIVFGSPYFQKLINPDQNPYPNDKPQHGSQTGEEEKKGDETAQ